MQLARAKAIVDDVVANASGPVSVRASFDPFFTFFLGGVAVVEDGRRIGAVGVSGLPGEADEQLANAANERSAAVSR